MKGKNAIRDARADRVYNVINVILLACILLIVAYPLYFVLIASVSSPVEVSSGHVLVAPVGLTFAGYEKIFNYSSIWLGYRNTFFYAALGTLISVIATITLAYPLSRKDFKLRNPLMMMVTITMFFSGGMIPTYLVVSKLGLIDTIWAVVVPGAINAMSVIIARTFVQSIPQDLHEAAAIDGATNFTAFVHIIVPLSKAIIAVIALYAASGLWNGYFGPMLYLSNRNLFPLQLFLRQILILNDVTDADISASTMAEQQQVAELIKYGVIIVSTVPMMLLYPFIQRYFVKGVMIGSLKG